MTKVLFREKQRFNQLWIWILIIGSTLITVIPFASGLHQQLILKEPWGNNPMSDTSLIIFSLSTFALMFGIIILFCILRLETVITEDTITVKYFPFIRKGRFIKADEISDIYVREYNPVSEYGGWGIKGTSKNRCYNTRGKLGIQIILNSGNKILIGTQKKEMAKAIVKKVKSKL